MTARERIVWEQAVRVLRQNSVIATVPGEPLGLSGYWRRPASGLTHRGGPEKAFEEGN